MSGSIAAVITIPIVVVIALFSWVFVVLHAEAHPHWKHKGEPPRTDAAGGAFLASDGGRQLMPIWGEEPVEIPAQREPAAAETYQTAGPEAAPEPAERAGTGQTLR